MTPENLMRANQINSEIKTLEAEIQTLDNMEDNTRKKKEGTHRLCLSKLIRKPVTKTAYEYWSSQNLDSIHSIILFDADEIKALVDVKRSKVERLREELASL